MPKNKAMQKNDEINDLNEENKLLKLNLDAKNETINFLNEEINVLKSTVNEKDNNILDLNEENMYLKSIIKEKEKYFDLDNYKNNFNKKSAIDDKDLIIKKFTQKSIIDSKKIDILFKEHYDNKFVLLYLKNNTIIKKLLSPLSYLIILSKSKPSELILNIKLYTALKSYEFFDIWFYLKNNKDIVKSNWCKYFSPELHYVCKGFDEGRKVSNKYPNIKSKKEVLNYILTCNKK